MRSFPVDDDLVGLVWAKAKPAPFEQLTFSDALRRILRQPTANPSSTSPHALTPPHVAADSGRPLEVRTRRPTADELLAEIEGTTVPPSPHRGRAPKADLRELVRLGQLKDGQELYFLDFRGQRHAKGKATISGDNLIYSDGRRYSMSALAGVLLKQQGYVGDSVRGPDHWATSDGKKVRTLWESALERRARK